ncbi:MAG: metal-dependent hydrolase [Myxococcales bacterium]|nr:metal-dependent hydrolase [Myxococcales bacterium]
MNPIVHAELSWLCAQRLDHRRDRVLVVLAGVVPDVDGLTLLAGEEAYGAYHHLLTHGYPAAIATVLACAALAKQRVATAALAAVAFHLHLLGDLAGSGPGWPIYYFWPTSRAEWFWRGQWDLASWQNTLIGLLATLACLGFALVAKRTVLELFSLRADAAVVRALRSRFLGEKSQGQGSATLGR